MVCSHVQVLFLFSDIAKDGPLWLWGPHSKQRLRANRNDAAFTIAGDIALMFPEGSAPHVIALIVAMIACLFGAAVGAGILTAWIALKHAFQFATGRSFVFTRRMAFIVSCIIATVLICTFIFHLYQAIRAGEISTWGGRGGSSPHAIFWSDNRGGFIWVAIGAAAALAGFWAMAASLLFKAAARSK
jgi:hypothetical protein